MPYALPLQVQALRAKLRRAERIRQNKKHNKHTCRAGWEHGPDCEPGDEAAYQARCLAEVEAELATTDWLSATRLTELATLARLEEDAR